MLTRIFARARLAAWAILLGFPLAGYAAEVEGLRVWSGPDATRVVLDLSSTVEYRVFSLANPHRIVVDLKNANARRPLGLPEPKGAVASVRSGTRTSGELRVVLDLSQAVNPKSFLLPPNEQYGHRLVIDLEAGAAGFLVKDTPPLQLLDAVKAAARGGAACSRSPHTCWPSW